MSSIFRMSVPASYDTTGIEHFTIPFFQFTNGETHEIHVALRQFNAPTTLGIEPESNSKPKVLIPTCYGGRINGTTTYAQGALRDRHVIVMAMLGNGESSSPSNTPDFPASLDYRDVVRAHHTVLTQHLGITHLEAVIGFSMGGQQAYHWTYNGDSEITYPPPFAESSKMYPTFISSAVSICSSARTSPHNFGFLEGPATALLQSIDYNTTYLADRNAGAPTRGLNAFGRAWCVWVFSSAWFREGHWRALAPTMDAFMTQVADRMFLDWDPHDLLILLRMWQKADLGTFVETDRSDDKSSGGDGVKDPDRALKIALNEIPVPVLVMPCRTDCYFDWRDSEIEVEHLRDHGGKLEIIESVWGHSAGGSSNPKDQEWVDGRIAAWLRSQKGDRISGNL